MPFPATLEQLEKSGYRYARMEVCKDCGQSVEVFTTPAKREVGCNPMPLITDPAIEHWRTCKPVVSVKNRDALQAAGYDFVGRVRCPKCARATDLYKHDGVEIFLMPMMDGDWPVKLHECEVKTGNRPTEVSGPKNRPPEIQQEHEGGKAGQEIKLYGVNDPNGQLIAVGWSDGFLVCQFKTAKWQYGPGVPEAEFEKLRKVPFAYRIFNTNILGKYPEIKLEG